MTARSWVGRRVVMVALMAGVAGVSSCSKAPVPKTSATDAASEEALPADAAAAPAPAEKAEPTKPAPPPSGHPAPIPVPPPTPAPVSNVGSNTGPLAGHDPFHAEHLQHLTPGLPPPAPVTPAAPPVTENPLEVASAKVPPAAPTDDELIEQALAKLPTGSMAYSIPPTMKTGETGRVSARVGSAAVSATALTAGMKGEDGGTVTTLATPVSVKMRVTLKSEDFAVSGLSSEEQVVGGTTPTEWDWDVTPKHAGKLHLRIAATVELHNIARDYTTVERDIPVSVDPVNAVKEFVTGNWQWLAGVLATGVGILWKFFFAGKKKEE